MGSAGPWFEQMFLGKIPGRPYGFIRRNRQWLVSEFQSLSHTMHATLRMAPNIGRECPLITAHSSWMGYIQVSVKISSDLCFKGEARVSAADAPAKLQNDRSLKHRYF